MTKVIKLLNKGQRVIHYGLKETDVLLPNKGAAFPAELGERLKRLFPDELTDVDDAVNAFASISEEVQGDEAAEGADDLKEKPLNEMTDKEISKVLKNYSLEVKKGKTWRADAIAAIEAHEAAEGGPAEQE